MSTGILTRRRGLQLIVDRSELGKTHERQLWSKSRLALRAGDEVSVGLEAKTDMTSDASSAKLTVQVGLIGVDESTDWRHRRIKMTRVFRTHTVAEIDERLPVHSELENRQT